MVWDIFQFVEERQVAQAFSRGPHRASNARARHCDQSGIYDPKCGAGLSVCMHGQISECQIAAISPPIETGRETGNERGNKKRSYNFRDLEDFYVLKHRYKPHFCYAPAKIGQK